MREIGEVRNLPTDQKRSGFHSSTKGNLNNTMRDKTLLRIKSWFHSSTKGNLNNTKRDETLLRIKSWFHSSTKGNLNNTMRDKTLRRIKSWFHSFTQGKLNNMIRIFPEFTSLRQPAMNSGKPAPSSRLSIPTKNLRKSRNWRVPNFSFKILRKLWVIYQGFEAFKKI